MSDILLSHRVTSMEESQTIAMAKKARELAASGVNIINLTLGEPDFQTPEHIKEAAKKAIDDGYTFYTPVSGYADLRKAISEKFVKENNIASTPEQIVVSTGAKQSIANTILCLVDPGDEVLILGPYWVSYLEIVKLAEGVPVVVNGSIENGFRASIETIEKAISRKTKVIIYSSPSNPTGAVFGGSYLAALADLVARHTQLYVIADEIYEHINFVGKHESLGAFKTIANRVITVNGVSKGFAMTGWRLGYINAPLAIAKACDKMQGQFTSGASSISQRAALAALTQSLQPTLDMANAFARRRALVYDLFSEIPHLNVALPEGAFYLFPHVGYYLGKRYGQTVINDVNDLAMYLLNVANVSTVPGDAFGAPEHIRLSFAASDEQLIEGAARIKHALAQLS
jgi:aspartate aminotransferase